MSNSDADDLGRCVLIVDRSEDTRDVLKTVLQRRGLSILEAREARLGLQLARTHRPQVIVLDLETEADDELAVRAAFDQHAADQDSALLVLGTARYHGVRDDEPGFMSKPYHFGPLVRKIEQLLEGSKHA